MEGGSETWSETAGAYVQSSPQAVVDNHRNVKLILKAKNQVTKRRSRR